MNMALKLGHFVPIMALMTVAMITTITHFVLLFVHPLGPFYTLPITDQSVVYFAVFEYALFITWNVVTLASFFRACFLGPGFLPLNWQPADPEHKKILQFCEHCNGYKPPRVHHCRVCKRCVIRMDHHCPWINTCLGRKNHFAFLMFVFVAPIGCIHSLVYFGRVCYHVFYSDWYRENDRDMYRQVYNYPLWLYLFVFEGIIMALGVALTVGGLFILQCRLISKNTTGIERWIINQAKRLRSSPEGSQYPEFVYPYTLSWKENFTEALLKPFTDDCLSWPLRPGCGMFDLTLEQARQKEAQRKKAENCKIILPYNGAYLPVFTHGCQVICCAPFMPGDNRMAVNVGDSVRVLEKRKFWLLGEIVGEPKGDHLSTSCVAISLTRSGWFPKRCAQFIPNSFEIIPEDRQKIE